MKEIMKASPNFGKGVSYKMCVVDEFHDMKELLEENTKLKAYNEKLLNGDIEKHNKIVELQKVCQDLSDKFDFQVKQAMKLEKENAELNDKLIVWVETAKIRLTNWQKLDNELRKAKEIIKSLMLFAEIDCREYEEAYKKAEQFLKEVS
jgi:hypothetical protein